MREQIFEILNPIGLTIGEIEKREEGEKTGPYFEKVAYTKWFMQNLCGFCLQEFRKSWSLIKIPLNKQWSKYRFQSKR